MCEDDGSHSNSNIDSRDAATEGGRAHRCRYDALLLADVGVWVATSFGREACAANVFTPRGKRFGGEAARGEKLGRWVYSRP